MTVFLLPMQVAAADLARWGADLDFMIAELAVRQPDFGRTMLEHRFRTAVERIRADIPRLSDVQVTIELARLLATLHDGHTGIFLPWDRQNGWHRLPLELWSGSDGLFVLAAPPEYQSLVGSVITRIGSADIGTITSAIQPLLPLDNRWGARSLLQSYVPMTELLRGLAFIDNIARAAITVRDADGVERTVVVDAVTRDARPEMRFIVPKERLPLWLSRRDEKYWFTSLPESRLTYVQFNSADVSEAEEPAFNEFLEQLVRQVHEKQSEKLVVDLRWNSGGSFMRTRKLLNAVIRATRTNRKDHLFTLISPSTYSAGATHASRLGLYTETLFVGEPTGGRPGHVGELRRFRLPNSKLEVRYSAVVVTDPGDRREAVMPDLIAPQSAAAYRASVDPAMEAVLAYTSRQPVAAAVRETLSREGAAAAVALYRRLARERYNDFIFSEEQLASLVDDLIRLKDFRSALAFAELYASEYAASAAAHFSLGSAQLASAEPTAAAQSFRKAFELDPRFTVALERSRELSRPAPNP